MRIKLWQNPVSFLGTPVAGDIEDTFTNLPLVAERLAKIADNTAYIYSLELLHAAQAVDLRTKLKGQFAMGKDSQELYKRYRQAKLGMSVKIGFLLMI